VVTMCVGVSNFVMLPVMGALSDKIGRRPQMLLAAAVAVGAGYPAMHWLAVEPSFARLLIVELGFALIYATYNGAMVAFLTEIMPPAVRTSAFSLAYSLATALFGGFTPAVATWLIHATGDRAIPGAWLSLAAVLALVSTITLGGRARSK
jgi:MFS family permease